MKKNFTILLFLLSSFMGFGQIQESKVIAGLIFRFAQFVEWPNESSIDTFQVLLISEDTLIYQEFDLIRQSHKLKGKPIRIKMSNSLNGIENIQLVYFDQGYEDIINRIDAANGIQPVLIVTYNYTDKLLSMINLVKDKKDKKITFEINKQNIDGRGFKYSPELLLYGGSLMDVKELYLKTYSELLEKTTSLEKLKADLDKLETEKKKFQLQINGLNDSFEELKNDIKLKEEEYQRLNEQIRVKDESLNKMNRILISNTQKSQILEKSLIVQNDSIIHSKKELSELNIKLLEKQKQLQENQAVIYTQSTKIETQQKRLYFSLILAFALVIVLISIYIALSAKKQLNNKLKYLVDKRTIELKKSQEYYLSLFENSPVAVCEFDLSELRDFLFQNTSGGDIQAYLFSDEFYRTSIKKIKVNDLNMQTLLLFGAASKKQFIENYYELFNEESFRGLHKMYIKILNNQSQTEYEITRVSFKGEIKQLYQSFMVLPGHESDYSKVLISMLDITELKDYEREVTRHRDHLEELVHERTKEIIKLNESLYQTNEELQSKNEDLSSKNRQLKEQQEEITTLNEELLESNHLLEDQKEQLEQLVQKLKETQDQLVESEKMASLGLLTAGVAHEINNPINFISSGNQALEMLISELWGHLENLKSKEFTSNEQFRQELLNFDNAIQKGEYHRMFDEIINGISLGVERTTEIVRSLQAYSRDTTNLNDWIELADAVNSSLVILKNKYKGRINVITHVQPNIYLNCSSGKINQVFVNIFSNAFDAIEGQGQVKISTAMNSADNKVFIEISDSGKGMDKDTLKKVFDPFFTTKETGKGTGLGLYITYGIIKQMKGTIAVTSEINMGTNFMITLPAKKEET